MIVNGPVVVGVLGTLVLAVVMLVCASTVDPTWSDRKRARVLRRRAAMRRHPSAARTTPPRPAWADLGTRAEWADIRRDVAAWTGRTDRVLAALHDAPLRVESTRAS